MASDRVLGIDLGTTNSVVCYYEQGQPIVIPNAEGSRTTPSVVFFKNEEEILVGELAKRQMIPNPKQAIRSVKRFMGCRYSEIGQKRTGIIYDIVSGPNDEILIDVGWKKVTPEEVSSHILKKMRQTAEDYFGEACTRAVITVPAYFNDNQRMATKRAGEIAGLEVLRIINEPTAASLAFGLNRDERQRIAVFDLGGGTFDITVLDIETGVFEVRSTHGDTFLGGDNIDDLLCQMLAERFMHAHGINLLLDPQASQRLRESVERAKCELSTASETLISLPFIAANASGPLHIQETVSREELNDLLAPLLPRMLECCAAALDDAKLTADQITSIVLVGGSTRIPAVQHMVREYFDREPNRSLNPDEAVAIGAAAQGAILSGGIREVILLDVTPLTLGIELAGGLFSPLIPRNSAVPTSVSKSFTTNKDNQANVRVHVLQGERKIASENHSLGVMKLTGIEPAPAGIPAIAVTFTIDADGILHVNAIDSTSGVSNSIRIESYGSSVTTDRAAQIVKEAESAADKDRAFVLQMYKRSQVDAILNEVNEAILEDEVCLDPEFVRQVREAAFKFDLACSTGAENDSVEASFLRVKQLGLEIGTKLDEWRLKRSRESSSPTASSASTAGNIFLSRPSAPPTESSVPPEN
jgi:molecular chaperone DnaK